MTNQDYWEDDGFSIVGNPGLHLLRVMVFLVAVQTDTISFGAGAQAAQLPMTYGALVQTLFLLI